MELFRLIRSLPSQSPDKSGIMGELCRIIRHLGRGIGQFSPFRLMNPAPPGYFSLAVERFEMTHASILTSFSPDFSGQKWTLRKSSGGQNGWAPVEMQAEFYTLNSASSKISGG